jgi:hypothetical protein
MRKQLAMMALALAGLVLAAGANERVRVFAFILTQADTVQQKQSAVSSLVELGDEAAAPYLADELDELLAARSAIARGSQTEEYERLVRILVKALGDWRYTNAAASLMRVVEDSADPLSRAEALIGLGSMRAAEYAEKIALLLRNLTFTPPADRDGGEKVAYGAVLALERMRSPLGFEQLFAASEGWYSKRVKEQAERSLELVLPDPSDAIRAIIAVDTPDRIIRALSLALRSQAPQDRQRELASLALERGISLSPGRTRAEQLSLAELRTRAMNALVALQDTEGRNAAFIAEAYRISSLDERLVALRALGTNRSAEAAAALSDIILRLNSDMSAGLVNDTQNTLMRAALQNAALNRRQSLATALIIVQNNTQKLSNAIIRLATESLKTLE